MDINERLRELGGFDHFLRAEWPQLRATALAKEEVAPRCERCILSVSARVPDPATGAERPLQFHNGVCEICLAAEAGVKVGPPLATPEQKAEQAKALDALLKTTAGKGRGKYDAVVLFSGGKDSAYLLHKLTTEFPKLRLLAVTIDNGFFSPFAMMNAKQVIAKIPVDHEVLKPPADLYRHTFRHAFTHLNPGGGYTTVDRMDGDLAFDLGRNRAAELDTPLLIAGMSPEQVAYIFRLTAFESPPEQERRRRTHSAGFDLDELYKGEDRKARWDGTAWPADRVPRVLYPFVAWPYDEAAIRGEVIRLGLIAEGQDNPLLTNNDTIPLMLAVDMNRMGYSLFEFEFADLVRTGRAERLQYLLTVEGIEYLSKRGQFLPKLVDATLARLGLSRADVSIPTG